MATKPLGKNRQVEEKNVSSQVAEHHLTAFLETQVGQQYCAYKTFNEPVQPD